MNEPLSFESLESTIEKKYPTPIAAVFRKCRTTKEGDLGSRHNNLKDLFETFIKFTSIVALQDARNCTPNLRDLFPQKEKTLEFLKRPSIGHWTGFLRIICALEITKPQPLFLAKIIEWYTQPKNKDTSKIIALFSKIGGINFQISKNPHADICDALVTYRNKNLGHGANLEIKELKRRLPLLEEILAYLLNSANFLSDILIFHTKDIKATEDKNRSNLTVNELVGDRSEERTYLSDSPVLLNEIYATYKQEIFENTTVFPLSPFLIWHYDGNEDDAATYFHNDFKRTYIEYLCYKSGAYYLHKELHNTFKDLLELKPFDNCSEVECYPDLTLEEKADQAENHNKLAVMHHRQGRFEDALKEYETTLIFERKASTFLKIAELENELKDPPNAVIMTIQSCLDLDPENEKALEFLKKIEGQSDINEGNITEEDDPRTAPVIKIPTIYHALTPKIFRRFAAFWWIAIILLWYLFSASIDWIAGNSDNLLPIALQCALCLVLVIPLTIVVPIINRMRIPLSLQLDTMRLERFESWFDNQLIFIFGEYVFESGKLRLMQSLKKIRGIIGYVSPGF